MKRLDLFRLLIVIFLSACGGGGSSSDQFDSQTAQEAVSSTNALHVSERSAYEVDAENSNRIDASLGRRSSSYIRNADLFVSHTHAFIAKTQAYATSRARGDRVAMADALQKAFVDDINYINARVSGMASLTSTQLADYLSSVDAKVSAEYSSIVLGL